MARYSLRDGKITADKISISGKLMVSDTFDNVLATTTVAVASTLATSASGALTIALQPDVPRGFAINNAFQAAYATGRNFMFVGYDAKGNYISESVSVNPGAGSTAHTNNAFAYLGSVYPLTQIDADASGTVAITLSGKLGLSHPITNISDLKTATRYLTAGMANAVGRSNYNIVSSATLVNTTYDTFEMDGAAADNLTGSTAIIRYLTEFQ